MRLGEMFGVRLGEMFGERFGDKFGARLEVEGLVGCDFG